MAFKKTMRLGEGETWRKVSGPSFFVLRFWFLMLAQRVKKLPWTVGLLGGSAEKLAWRDLLDGQRVFLDGRRDFFLGQPDFEGLRQALFSGSEGPFSTSEGLFSASDGLKRGSQILSKYGRGGKRSVRGTF
jgi:hypothetical protein